MLKRVKTRKFNRPKAQRKALLNILASNLILRGKIKTTQAKAKELKGFAEKLISKAKVDSLASRRQVLKYLPEIAVKKVFLEIAPKYKERPGGYLRIIALGQRRSDGAEIAQIEFV